MRRILPLALAALTAACASTGGDTPPATQRAVYTNQEAGSFRDANVMTTSPVEGTTTDDFPGGTDAAIRALSAALAELGIEVTLLDPQARRVGNPRFQAYRTFAGSPISHYLSCGENLSGVSADRDRIWMSLVSTVTPAPDGGSVMSTRLEAVAVDRESGNSGATMPCHSLGVLERRLHRIALLKAGG